MVSKKSRVLKIRLCFLLNLYLFFSFLSSKRKNENLILSEYWLIHMKSFDSKNLIKTYHIS